MAKRGGGPEARERERSGGYPPPASAYISSPELVFLARGNSKFTGLTSLKPEVKSAFHKLSIGRVQKFF